MHSMGGLVVKKVDFFFVPHSIRLLNYQAYIVGKGDDRYSGLVAKVRGMVFLSTPHKGSGLAKTFNNILRSTPRMSSKAYVGELEQGSSSLQDINEQFRTACQNLELVSFYETQKTSIVGIKKLVKQCTLFFLSAYILLTKSRLSIEKLLF
jgi:triacylglycerol esterase/lipase EstA (alpha/beta hydrolase family)